MQMRITERDTALLSFAAEHRIVLATQARALMETSQAAAYRRLATLSAAGMLSRPPALRDQPGCYQITVAGLAEIESELPKPRFNPHGYRHDVGVGWLWLAARAGAFGELEQLISERRMRSLDGIAEARGQSTGERFGVRLGGSGPGGRTRLHYPDLLLIDGAGRRVATELELSSKGRTRREGIIAGYGADPRVDAVLYLCDTNAVQRAIRAAAARVGVSPLVHVQRLRWSAHRPGARAPRALERRPKPRALVR
jgi:hypothetical protein